MKEFNRVLRPLGCNHTGRGSDGNGRRAKLQLELAHQARKELQAKRAAALVLQRRWRRQAITFFYVIAQVMRRRRAAGTPLVRISLTFTMAISLEGAKGFTFAVSVVFVL